MRSRFALGAVLSLALALPGALACAHNDRDISFTMNVNGNLDVITCSDVDMKFWSGTRMNDDIVNVRRDQTVAVSTPRSGALRVAASSQGAVWVQHSSNGAISATICTVAGSESQSASNNLLDQLRIVNQGGELRVEGPEKGDWAAYVILSVPNGTSLDLEAENGALDVRAVSGTISMREQNGPISIAHAGGKLTVHSANGPISFVGHEGDIEMEAANGPLSVNFDDPTWIGKGLVASTRNGPISLFTPDHLKTGVQVASSQGSPWSWEGRGNIDTWDDRAGDRSVVIGKGPVLVRVSSGNGPVSIKSHAAPVPVGGKSRI